MRIFAENLIFDKIAAASMNSNRLVFFSFVSFTFISNIYIYLFTSLDFCTVLSVFLAIREINKSKSWSHWSYRWNNRFSQSIPKTNQFHNIDFPCTYHGENAWNSFANNTKNEKKNETAYQLSRAINLCESHNRIVDEWFTRISGQFQWLNLIQWSGSLPPEHLGGKNI